MKIKNEYVKIKQGKNEVELHNLILDKYLSLFASSVLETKYKGLDSCLINCTIQEEITPSMDNMHWDFYLNEQNLYNNSDYKGTSKIITKYLYEPNFKEQIQSFIGQKILSIGFAQMVEEPTLPDGSDATFELYAILDVSNYNLYVQDMQEFVVERVDTVTTDMVFSSDTEKFPIHLSPRGNSYFDQQEEAGTREVGILKAIGKGYNSMFPTALIPKSNFNITRNENEIDITGLSIQENTGEELYPSNELYPKKKWSEEIQKSEKGSEVIIEGNNKEAFVDIEGKSVQNGTPSPSNPSEIHSVADDVNLFDVTSIPEWVGGSTSYSVNNNTLKVAGPWFVGYLLDVDKNTDYYFSNIKTIITSTVEAGKILVMDNSKNNVIKFIYNENEMTFNTGSYSQIYILFYCGDGNYGEVDFTNIKLQKGTVSTPYSPYNQGTVTIKQGGKNLAYTGWASNFVSRINNSNLASLTTKDGKNCLKFDRTAGYRDYDNKYLFKTNWKENTQYTLSCNLFAEGSGSYANIQVRYTDGTASDHRYDRTENAWKSYTLTSAENKTIKDITAHYLAGINYIDLDTFMIYEGTQETSYEPYQTPHDYTIQTEPLRSLPNGVKDTIEEDGIHRRVGRIVLDGTDNWSFATEGDNTNGKTFYSNRKSDMKSLTYQEVISLDDIFVISDTFKGYAFKELNKTPRKLNFISLGINTLLINISNETGVKTVEEFKTYLNNNPIVVQYQLNEEVIEPFTEEQMEVLRSIQTFEGYNNFTTTDDLQPVIQVTEYENCVYPQKAQMNWIFYQYGIYKFIDTVTGYEYTGRLYREAKNTNKSGNLSLKIKYERGE